MYPTLLRLFEDGLSLLIRTSDHGKYALDQYWKPPQLTDAWFMIRPVLMYQQAAISTICGSCPVDVSTWYDR